MKGLTMISIEMIMKHKKSFQQVKNDLKKASGDQKVSYRAGNTINQITYQIRNMRMNRVLRNVHFQN
jgi:hypothetical protein